MENIGSVVLWLVLYASSVVAGVALARRRKHFGQSYVGIVIALSVLLSWVGVLVALVDTVRCPFCKELIQPSAKICRYCGADVIEGKPGYGQKTVTVVQKEKSFLGQLMSCWFKLFLIFLLIGVAWLVFAWYTAKKGVETLTETGGEVAKSLGKIGENISKPAKASTGVPPSVQPTSHTGVYSVMAKENVPVSSETTSASSSIDTAKIKSAIKAWQGKRWKGDVITSARKDKGKVSISDLTEECETAELQPVMDILVADYVMLVNCVDAYAEADNEAAALAAFHSSLSMSDIAKTLEDSAKIVQTLNDLRKETGSFELAKVKALGVDAITIGKMTLSIGDVCGLAKDLLSQKP